MATCRYSQKPGVVAQRFDDDVMLFDEKTDKIHTLNSSATFIWECMRTPSSIEQIEERVRDVFDVGDFDADLPELIRTTVRELKEKGLILAHDTD